MSLRHLKLITTSDHAGQRLDQVLTEWLSERMGRPLSKAKARKLVMAGVIRLNGKPVRIATQLVRAGTRIEAGIDSEKLFADSTSRDRPFELTRDRILFEDDDLIVVDKPPSLPCHPTIDESRDSLSAAVSRYLSQGRAGAAPYLGIHHRLDRDTSGVVLFTKSERVNAAVAELFSNHRVRKVYHALTAKRSGSKEKLRKAWTVENHLGRITTGSKRPLYGAVQTGGDLAITAFRILAEHSRGLWIEAIPKTGRTHQIRVHLAEGGLPILGDDLYGGASHSQPLSAPRSMLHASGLAFPHPITQREISIASPAPADFLDCINRLKE